ncbi:hypothetical protein LCGC14_2851350 [marine sediment metagenome]|uniref:Uncharacterized protein n=1 Tax=marine sediment metagenome TaxID=412755 RepID=A0A0F9AGL0_9ZZZZ
MKKDITETKQKIIRALEGKKEYEVTYKFSDVFEIIEAGSKEEAEQIADDRVESDRYNPKHDTSCYEIEVEEGEEE